MLLIFCFSFVLHYNRHALEQNIELSKIVYLTYLHDDINISHLSSTNRLYLIEIYYIIT